MRRELLRFGGWFQVNNLAQVVNQQTDAILIASFVNVRSVGYYGIGSKIADLVRTSGRPPRAAIAAATGIHAEGDERRIVNTVRQGGRLIGLLTLGSRGLRRRDVAADHGGVAGAQLSACSRGRIPAGARVCGAQPDGRRDYGRRRCRQAPVESEYAVVAMMLNIGATLALVTFFGLYGVVVGTVIGVVGSSAFFLARFHRLMNLPAWDIWDLALALTAATTLAGAPVLLPVWHFPPA